MLHTALLASSAKPMAIRYIALTGISGAAPPDNGHLLHDGAGDGKVQSRGKARVRGWPAQCPGVPLHRLLRTMQAELQVWHVKAGHRHCQSIQDRLRLTSKIGSEE